ncbi:hypothetical protein BU15DRAFT_80034, partial [Melanogaster broomeanus]
MPATRSLSRQHLEQPLSQQPYQHRGGPSESGPKKTLMGAPSNPEIIVLSSDDDDLPSKRTSSKKKSSSRPPRKKAATAAHPFVSGDVLEISSSDESQPVAKSSPKKHLQSSEATIKDLQCTIKKLQEELKQSQQVAAREIEGLKHKVAVQ